MKKIKKAIGAAVFASIILTGCSANSNTPEATDNFIAATNVITEASTPEPTIEPTAAPTPVPTATTEPVVTVILQKDFDKANKIDTEEKKYINGQFLLKDDTTINADFVTYVDGSYYSYASAIFYKGELASIEVDTLSSIEDVLKGIGITTVPDDAIIEQYKSKEGWEIHFNPIFHDSNIAMYPFEMD